jgi:hypothetical protein
VLGVREDDGRVFLGHLVDCLLDGVFAQTLRSNLELLDRPPLEDLVRLELASQVCREEAVSKLETHDIIAAPRRVKTRRYTFKSPSLPFRTGDMVFRIVIVNFRRFRKRDHFSQNIHDASAPAVAGVLFNV